MAVANTPLHFSKKSQEAVIAFYTQCINLQNQQWNLRSQLEAVDRAYMSENDYTAENVNAQIANSYGNSNKTQNITIPVVAPAVETAVEYQTSVFLTGSPIFGVVAPPQFEDEAVQMETVIENQSIRGGWARELMLFFRDGFKYNISALEVSWETCVTAAVETDLEYSAKEAKPTEIIYEGNKLTRWDPYNTYWDLRVKPTEMHLKGEFVGKVELMSRIQLKQFIARLPNKMIANIPAAFASGIGSVSTQGFPYGSYYIPQINPNCFNIDPRASTNWLAWAGAALSDKNSSISYRDIYEVQTVYARILPSDFSLIVPAANTPQIFKFIIVNGRVVIYAERQTNAHEMLPVLFGQPLEDGLSYQTKSLAVNAKPFQAVSSSLMNSVLAARRRAISDRGLFDPSRVSEAHINSTNPSAKIPVRPNAFGKPLSEAYYPIPFNDDQSGLILQEIDRIGQWGSKLIGQNQARQGQFVKGNKTLREYESVMSHANGRDQMTAILYEAQVFTPMKEILKINILQYQGTESLYSADKKKVVNIDPVALRKAVLNFKVSDGLVPTEKLISSDVLGMAFNTIGSSQQLNSQYNLAPMFSYLMKTQGADIAPFEKSKEQVAYEQAVAQWQQAMAGVSAALAKNPEQAQQLMQQLPPQPTPQQFGYNPSQQGVAPAAPPTEVATRVNNITNVITNQEQ